MKTENKVLSFTPKDAINASHRKENSSLKEYSVHALQGKEIQTPVSLRIYGKYAGKIYACIWVNGKTKQLRIYATGSGSASGGGYDKISSATATAIERAGVNLFIDIDGKGEEAVKDALEAITIHLGYKIFTVHTAHG